MKIPTGHLRLLQDQRSDAEPPKLQQWWIEVFAAEHPFDVLNEMAQEPKPDAIFGEWVDVPMVYGESDHA
jgi:hypothetical protein